MHRNTFSLEAERSTFRLPRITREQVRALMRDLDMDAVKVVERAVWELWQREIGDAPRDVLAELDEVKAITRHMNRRATMLIVAEGEVHPIEDAAQFPVDRYGVDWIAVEARDAADALAQAALYDAGAHPAQVEMRLFAAMVQSGAVTL